MQITQIYISTDNEPPRGPVSSYMNAIRSASIGHVYTCFDNNLIEDFLRDGYGLEMLNAYRQLAPYAFKADLARYCILYRLGGWYIDAGLQWCLPSFSVDDHVDLIAFRDNQRYWGNSWSCANGLIYAKPGHPALKQAIQRSFRNIKDKYYGSTPLCPTGPMLWGAAIAQIGLSSGTMIGDFMQTTRDYQYTNTCLVLPSGRIAARWKPHLPAGGRLGDAGNRGLNDYMAIWKQRNVYHERSDAKEIFTRYYQENVWGDPESRSGSGSSLRQAGALVQKLPQLFDKYKIQSILDAPCGDFHWFKEIALGDSIHYTGVDIVERLVEDNSRRYARQNVVFLCLDLIKDPIPAADLVIMRDCLVHLSFEDIKLIIESLKRSGSTYLLATQFADRDSNSDIATGGWRPLNLLRPPFDFPPPIELINEECAESGGAYSDKSLALWNIEDLGR